MLSGLDATEIQKNKERSPSYSHTALITANHADGHIDVAQWPETRVT